MMQSMLAACHGSSRIHTLLELLLQTSRGQKENIPLPVSIDGNILTHYGETIMCKEQDKTQQSLYIP